MPIRKTNARLAMAAVLGLVLLLVLILLTGLALPASASTTAAATATATASLYSGGDPFVPVPPDTDAAGTVGQTNEPTNITPRNATLLPPLYMLGTVHDHGTAYALIGAGKQVFCLRTGAPLPPWPLSIGRITDTTVALEQSDPGGSERHVTAISTLRLGEPGNGQQFDDSLFNRNQINRSKDSANQSQSNRRLSGSQNNRPDNAPGERMSLKVKGMELAALLQVFARFYHTNIVLSDDIKGAISVHLQDLSWPQALQALLQSKGLAAHQLGNVIWIAPQEEIARQQKAELRRHAEQTALTTSKSALEGELFQLNYQKAETLRKLLHIGDDGHNKAGADSTLLSARGSAIVDARSNQLLITDTPAALQRVRALIKKIDIASRQVMIQAYIVEANHQFSRNLGVRLGFAGGAGTAGEANPAAATGANADAGATLNPAINAINVTATQHYNMAGLNLPARAIAGLNAGQLALSLFNPTAAHFLTLELSALEADGKGRVVSSPRVVTADQQAALIEQGEEMPYQESAGEGVTATAFKKANLKLEVTPQITPDNQIILRVDIKKDSRGLATPAGLAINTKHIKTQVQVENDGTVVIGGIYTETTIDNVTKVPLLGDLPLLGNLFRSTSTLHDKTELLIFLTPKIIGTGNLAQ